MQNEWKHTHHILKHVKGQSIEQTDKHRVPRPGDIVFASMTPEQPKQFGKACTLGQTFTGPYRVLEATSDNTFKLQLPAGDLIHDRLYTDVLYLYHAHDDHYCISPMPAERLNACPPTQASWPPQILDSHTGSIATRTTPIHDQRGYVALTTTAGRDGHHTDNSATAKLHSKNNHNIPGLQWQASL